jgi:hypothetical protein
VILEFLHAKRGMEKLTGSLLKTVSAKHACSEVSPRMTENKFLSCGDIYIVMDVWRRLVSGSCSFLYKPEYKTTDVILSSLF